MYKYDGFREEFRAVHPGASTAPGSQRAVGFVSYSLLRFDFPTFLISAYDFPLRESPNSSIIAKSHVECLCMMHVSRVGSGQMNDLEKYLFASGSIDGTIGRQNDRIFISHCRFRLAQSAGCDASSGSCNESLILGQPAGIGSSSSMPERLGPESQDWEVHVYGSDCTCGVADVQRR